VFVEHNGDRMPGTWDDLESLLYTLIFCWRGYLNWNFSGSLYNAKIELLQNPSNLPLPLQRMASYIYSNSYLNQKNINYEELESILNNAEEFNKSNKDYNTSIGNMPLGTSNLAQNSVDLKKLCTT